MQTQKICETEGELFQALIAEFIKPSPDESSIEKFMSELNLEYHDDTFTNMAQVLLALSFHSSQSRAQRLPRDC